MKHKGLTRVLALDLHPRRFGYVVIENPDRLLDWGARSHCQKDGSTDVFIQKRLKPLLKLWRPSLLLRNQPRMMEKPNQRGNKVLNRIATVAKSHRVHVRVLKKRPAADEGKRLTKYENARLVAERFPILARSLPPKRKPWESEDYRMSMFAAVGLAMMYFGDHMHVSHCRTMAD
jgi:hypothetical protein